MKYFAYGSNMSIRRLQARIPDAMRLTTAVLSQHSLRFHKEGADNSAKCDAFYTANHADQMWGVVFQMPAEQRAALDRAEGLGFGYNAKQVNVISTSGESLSALTYYAIRISSEMLPFDWYLNHVLIGARESNLPENYIAGIESVTAVADPDTQRALLEYAIHKP